jgi:type II secretory pathway pseudopilin PulG
MKPSGKNSAARAASAFSLIELIGVLAIMTIMASVLVPNVLKSIDRAAVKAEAETLDHLGDAAKLYLRDTGVELTSANWSTALGPYASLNPTELLTNRRQNSRIYIADPATHRAMLVSSMRATLALPATLNFNAVWNWNETNGVRPSGFDAGWTDYLEYLVIERINYQSIYGTDLQLFTITLKNLSGSALTPGGTAVPAATASYEIVRAGGAVEPSIDVAPGASAGPLTLHPKDRIGLYRAAGALSTALDSTYVVSTTGKSFYFDGTNWLPQ